MGSTNVIASPSGVSAPPTSYARSPQDQVRLPPHGFQFFQSDDPVKKAARASFGRPKSNEEPARPQTYWERELPRLPQSNPLVGSAAEVSKAEQQRDELLAIFRERFQTEKINVSRDLENGAKKNWQASERDLQENLKGVSGFFTYISGTSEGYEKTVEADYGIYLGRRKTHRQQKEMLEKFDEFSALYKTQRAEAMKAAEEFRTLSAAGDNAGAQAAYERASALLEKSDNTWTQAITAIGKPDTFDYRKHMAALRGANVELQKGIHNLNRIETAMRITQKVVIIGGAALATTLSGGAGTPLLIAALQGTGVAFAASALSNTAELGMGYAGYGQEITWDKVKAKAYDTLTTTAEAGLNCLGAAAALKYAYYMSRGAQTLHWCSRARTAMQTVATQAGQQASTWGARALTLSRQLFLIGGPSGVIASAPSTIYHNTQAVMRGDFHRLNPNSQEVEFQTGMFLQSLGIQFGMSYSCGMFGNAFGQMRTATQNSPALSRMLTYGGSNLVEGYGSYITTKWSMDLEDVVRGKGNELTAEEREQRIISAIVGHFAGMGSEKISNLHNKHIADAAVTTSQDGRRLGEVVGGETLLKDAGTDVEVAAVAKRQQDGTESTAAMRQVDRMRGKIRTVPADADPEVRAKIEESNASLQREINKILRPENTDAQSSRAARMAGTAHVDADGRIYIRMSNDETRLPIETLAASEQIAVKKMLAMDRKSGHVVDMQLQARKRQIVEALEAAGLKPRERRALIEQLCGVEEKVTYRVYDKDSKTTQVKTKDMLIGGEVTEAYLRFSRLPKSGASKQEIEALAKGLIAEADQAFHRYKNGDLYDSPTKPGGKFIESVKNTLLSGPQSIGTHTLRLWRGMKRLPVVGGVFRLTESVASVTGLTFATRAAVAHLTPTTAGALGPAIGFGMALYSTGRKAGTFLARKAGLFDVRPRDAARAMALRQQCSELEAMYGKDIDPDVRAGLRKAQKIMSTQAREAGQRGPGVTGLVVPPVPFLGRSVNAVKNVFRSPARLFNVVCFEQPFTLQRALQKIPGVKHLVPSHEVTSYPLATPLWFSKFRKLDYDVGSGAYSPLLQSGISMSAREGRGFSFSRSATALRSTLSDGFTSSSNSGQRNFDQHLRLSHDSMHESVAGRMRLELMQEVPIKMRKEYAEAKLKSLDDVASKSEAEIHAHLEALRKKDPADLTDNEIADLRSNMESYIGWVNGSKGPGTPTSDEAVSKQNNRHRRRRENGLVDDPSPNGRYEEAGPGIPSKENVRTLAEHHDAHMAIRAAREGGSDPSADTLARVGLRNEDTVSLDQVVKKRIEKELFWVTRGTDGEPNQIGGQLGEWIMGARSLSATEVDQRLALLYDSASPKARREYLAEMKRAARSVAAENPDRAVRLELLAKKCEALEKFDRHFVKDASGRSVEVDSILMREFNVLRVMSDVNPKTMLAGVVKAFEDVAPILGPTILTPERQAAMLGDFHRQVKGKVTKTAMDLPDADKKRVKALSGRSEDGNKKGWARRFEDWTERHSDDFTPADLLVFDDIRSGYHRAIADGVSPKVADQAARLRLEQHAESIRAAHQENLPRARKVLAVLDSDVMPRQRQAMAKRLKTEGTSADQLSPHELFSRYAHGNTSRTIMSTEVGQGLVDAKPRMVRGISGNADEYNAPWNAYPIFSPRSNAFRIIKSWFTGKKPAVHDIKEGGRLFSGTTDFFRPFRRRTHRAVTSGPTAPPRMG